MAAIKPLVSSLARFVQGDIKGGADAHAFRVETIRNAIEQMFKGNYSPITEAATLTQGKAKKARAYHAGFATFGEVGTDTKKVAYTGSLQSAENKLARDQIAAQTQAACGVFFAAFDVVMSEKAAPKVAKAETVAAPVAAPVTEAETDDALRHELAVEQDNTVAAVIAMIRGGMLTGEQLGSVAEALDAAMVPVHPRELTAQMLKAIKAGTVCTEDLESLDEALTAVCVDASSNYPTHTVTDTQATAH